MISELPNSDQRRFPTAYGLFRSIEDRISSPQAFPLKWAHDYDQSDVDGKHNDLEELILGIKKTARSGNTFKDKDLERGYFILPVFFGSLPLFALVLKFPNLLPVASTGASVFHAALTNLHDQIKVVFDDRFVRNHIISPFIASALEALHTQTCSDNKSALPHRNDRIGTYLDLIEDRLFGLPHEDSARTTWKDREGGVLNREWKSWVLTIPSQPIKELQSAQAENARLWSIWEAEKERALLDHALRISYWFEEADFFGKKAHDEWKAGIHVPLLAKILEIAGAKGWDNLAGDGVEVNGYLMASSDSYFLRWAVKTLTSLAKTPSDSRCDNDYQNLKSVFCKLRANHGPGVRFSWKRLKNIINAAIAHKDPANRIVRIAEQDLPINTCWKGLDGTFWCRNDPSIALGDIAEWLAGAGFLEKATFMIEKFQNPAADGTAKGNVVFTLKDAGPKRGLARDCGGCDLLQLEEAFLRAGIETDEFNTKAFDKSELTINLNLSREKRDNCLLVETDLTAS